jgi:hypothetical protein
MNYLSFTNLKTNIKRQICKRIRSNCKKTQWRSLINMNKKFVRTKNKNNITKYIVKESLNNQFPMTKVLSELIRVSFLNSFKNHINT